MQAENFWPLINLSSFYSELLLFLLLRLEISERSELEKEGLIWWETVGRLIWDGNLPGGTSRVKEWQVIWV